MKSLSNYINEALSAKGQWDTQHDMHKEGTIGNTVWNLMYGFYKKPDFQHLIKLSSFIDDTFEGISCTVPTPNHPEWGIIKAMKDGKEVARLDCGCDKIELHKIQEFLDKISK